MWLEAVLTTITRSRCNCFVELPGGFIQGQEVWSLYSGNHATKQIRFGDHGIVQGPAKGQIKVLFDAPTGVWHMNPEHLSTTMVEVCYYSGQ